mmetsp:Transcript_32502/g.37060  ORF Transcript_32502/g.37060 Transcript_32502/m.37060 type:complete len:232 (-) Transcript_32502:39-734(-)
MKFSTASNNTKLKQEIQSMKKERSVILKEKEDLVKEANKNYVLYIEAKNEATQLESKLADFNKENRRLHSENLKFKDFDKKYSKLKSENNELKMILEGFKKNDFDIIRKLDLDEYNLTSDDLRSEKNKKYQKGIYAKGHPLVPKLDFEKIYAWREQHQEDTQDEDLEEEESEEELLTENEQFLPKGSEVQTSASQDRRKGLEKRKEEIISILNKTYAEELQDDCESSDDNH